ncbi:MarR family transcriptional regulator [bacterium]|nr:MarR family transcriptional regulator [bacterium]
MPHALSDRQKEYLLFIEKYIQKNQDSPSLQEIAENFQVKPSTAHKTLDALQKKGFIYSTRHPASGFYVRLIEHGGMAEQIIAVPIVGDINKYGELVDLPDISALDKLDSEEDLSSVFPGVIPIVIHRNEFAPIIGFRANYKIHAAGINEGDIVIVELNKTPENGFIAIVPMGIKAKLVLCWSFGKTYDDRLTSWLMREPYPIPQKLVDQDLGQKLICIPVGFDDYPDYYESYFEEGGFPLISLPTENIFATVIEIIREY